MLGGGGEDEAVLALAAAARPMVGRADVSGRWRQDVAGWAASGWPAADS